MYCAHLPSIKSAVVIFIWAGLLRACFPLLTNSALSIPDRTDNITHFIHIGLLWSFYILPFLGLLANIKFFTIQFCSNQYQWCKFYLKTAHLSFLSLVMSAKSFRMAYHSLTKSNCNNQFGFRQFYSVSIS